MFWVLLIRAKKGKEKKRKQDFNYFLAPSLLSFHEASSLLGVGEFFRVHIVVDIKL